MALMSAAHQRGATPPAGGPSSTFETLYRTELRPITAVVAAMVGDIEVARELTNEAMLRAYRDWGRVSVLDHPGAWVRRVAINLAIDTQRRRGRERRAVERLAGQPDESTNEIPAEPDAARYWRLVRDLPEQQRAVVTLRYVEDLAQHQIADVLGIPEGTVKSQLFKARHRLAAALAKENR